MNKIVSRLLIFFIGIPLVICLVFLKVYNHLALHVVLCAVSVVASNELYEIFKVKNALLPKPLVAFCSFLIPLTAGISSVVPAFTGKSFPIGQEIITFAFIFTFLLLLSYEVFTASTFEASNIRLAASVFIVLYAGYLLTFISRMTVFSRLVSDTDSATITEDVSIPYISVFLMMVFICDSLAWFFGMLLGKNNRGVVKASPNKSIAGFIGGTVGSVLAGLAGYFLWPDVFWGSPVKMIVLSLIISFSAIVGDLVESIFKRSSNFKDSGHIIPGRGGILDSIDSILMSAPIFYLLVTFFYNPIH